MKITREWLESNGACDVDRFAAAYPDGVELTAANIEADTHGWDWSWLAGTLLPEPHRDAYYAACKPHLDAYCAARKPHRDAYDAACKREFIHAATAAGVMT